MKERYRLPVLVWMLITQVTHCIEMWAAIGHFPDNTLFGASRSDHLEFRAYWKNIYWQWSAKVLFWIWENCNAQKIIVWATQSDLYFPYLLISIHSKFRPNAPSFQVPGENPTNLSGQEVSSLVQISRSGYQAFLLALANTFTKLLCWSIFLCSAVRA